MDNVSIWMSDRLSALLMSPMPLQLHITHTKKIIKMQLVVLTFFYYFRINDPLCLILMIPFDSSFKGHSKGYKVLCIASFIIN